MIIVEFLEWINPIFWVSANLMLIYIGVLLSAFTILYPTLFDPSATRKDGLPLFFVSEYGGSCNCSGYLR